MTVTRLDIDRAARAAATAQSLAIVDLCASAGQPVRAASFIRAGYSIAEVRHALERPNGRASGSPKARSLADALQRSSRMSCGRLITDPTDDAA